MQQFLVIISFTFLLYSCASRPTPPENLRYSDMATADIVETLRGQTMVMHNYNWGSSDDKLYASNEKAYYYFKYSNRVAIVTNYELPRIYYYKIWDDRLCMGSEEKYVKDDLGCERLKQALNLPNADSKSNTYVIIGLTGKPLAFSTNIRSSLDLTISKDTELKAALEEQGQPWDRYIQEVFIPEIRAIEEKSTIKTKNIS